MNIMLILIIAQLNGYHKTININSTLTKNAIKSSHLLIIFEPETASPLWKVAFVHNRTSGRKEKTSRRDLFAFMP